MTNEEIKLIQYMPYDELCTYLKNKYGNVKEDYFINQNCSTPNKSIKRIEEGLYIHHIMEKQFPDLSKKEKALLCPYEFQKSNNLVYCNEIEHLLLHIRIVKEFFNIVYLQNELIIGVGIGGILNHIGPEIADFYNGYVFNKKHLIKALNVLVGHENEIIQILTRFVILDYPEAEPFLCFHAKGGNRHWKHVTFGSMVPYGPYTTKIENSIKENKNLIFENINDFSIILKTICQVSGKRISIKIENKKLVVTWKFKNKKDGFRYFKIDLSLLERYKKEIDLVCNEFNILPNYKNFPI